MLFRKFINEESCDLLRNALLESPDFENTGSVSVLKIGRSLSSLIKGLTERLMENPVVSSYLLLDGGVFDIRMIRYGDGAQTDIKYGYDVTRARSDLTLTLFLSKAHTYGGGEHEIITYEGTNVVKGDLGDLSIHPARYGHRVRQVIGGESIVLTGSVRSQISDDNNRHILFRLRSVAESLQTELGDKEEIFSLRQIYNELHRTFSST